VNVTVRQAARSDFPAILEIEALSFQQPHWAEADFLRFDTTVAVVDSRVVGFLVTREIFAGDSELPREREILNVAVHPNDRGRGIATRLLRNEMKSAAVYFLEVRQSNLKAQKLYRYLGFEEIGRRKDYYDHPRETAIVMKVK
jgi:[ribosomal protein S18]-alanine N-acetyltransferase